MLFQQNAPRYYKYVVHFCALLLMLFTGINSTKAQFGIINTIAGTGTAGYTGDGGAATQSGGSGRRERCGWKDGAPLRGL